MVVTWEGEGNFRASGTRGPPEPGASHLELALSQLREDPGEEAGSAGLGVFPLDLRHCYNTSKKEKKIVITIVNHH